MEHVSSKEFSTYRVRDKNNVDEPTQRYVVLNGVKTDAVIEGIVLEDCVRIYDYYLVFMTQDCPFEEGLSISLLDKGGKVLETKEIYQGYCTDDFSDLRLYPPNVVTFDFLYREPCAIEVYPTFRYYRPFNKFESLINKILGKHDGRLGTYWTVKLGV